MFFLDRWQDLNLEMMLMRLDVVVDVAKIFFLNKKILSKYSLSFQ